MRTRNYLPQNDNFATSKTAKQWQKEGFTPKDGVTGEYMYHNGHRQNGAIYYRPCDVRPATDAEISQWNEVLREQRRKATISRKERKKREDIRHQHELEMSEERHRQELARQESTKSFYSDIISHQKKFVLVSINGYVDPLVYIVPSKTSTGSEITVPLGYFNSPTSGIVCGDIDLDSLIDEKWFPNGVKEALCSEKLE